MNFANAIKIFIAILSEKYDIKYQKDYVVRIAQYKFAICRACYTYPVMHVIN